jgi:hypothetical protein
MRTPVQDIRWNRRSCTLKAGWIEVDKGIKPERRRRRQ